LRKEECVARFAPSPSDFAVEEIARLPLLRSGPFTLYRLHKRGLTTLEAQQRLATALGVPSSALVFPALKDREARSVQLATLQGQGPDSVEGLGFRAQRLGYSPRPLTAKDLTGNRFTAVVRDLSPEEAACIPGLLAGLHANGLPNYFDQQRFGSHAPGHDWVGKLILQRDAEGALRAHLAQPFVGDPETVRMFKSEAQRHWGDWRYLLQVAPRPYNFRSVLTFLADHPAEYRKALNLVTPRLLSLYLAAYQSLLWNRLAARYLVRALQGAHGWPAATLRIAGEDVPFYRPHSQPVLSDLRQVALPLFQQRMARPDPTLNVLIDAVLGEEGLGQAELKARLLSRAYLTRGSRALLVFPSETECSGLSSDETAAGRQKATVCFVLPRGSYGTLVLKLLVRLIAAPPSQNEQE
jgi:tRNA pseudouridine13 synthase